MSQRRSILAAFFAVALQVAASPATGATPVKEVQVMGPRVHLIDVVPTAPAAFATADLGPAPAPGGSRFVTQEELRTAAAGASAKVIASLPPAIRVVRKMRKLTAVDLERETRKAILATGLRRGVTIAAVRAPKSSEIADGWTSITASVPKPPRRAGRVPTTAALTFSRGAEILARLAVPIDLDLAAEAAIPDIAKGAALAVTVKMGLVEITAAALAAADADIGEELLVTLRPSGRVLRAVLIAPGKALIATPSSAPRPRAPAPPAPVAPSASAPIAPAPASPPANTASPPANTASPPANTAPSSPPANTASPPANTASPPVPPATTGSSPAPVVTVRPPAHSASTPPPSGGAAAPKGSP